MGASPPLVQFFGDEWDRFNDGLEQLDPASGRAYYEQWKRYKLNPDGTKTVNIPGWTDIVHVGARYEPTDAERTEYWKAQAQRREPNLAPVARQELDRRLNVRRRMASDLAPDYARGLGTILTAIDNVQDFLSTIATTARLGLWGAERTVQAILPGTSEATARAMAEVAARRAAATATADFTEAVARRAAAGELVARLAQADGLLFAAARREAARVAAEEAFNLTFRRVALGVAARVVGRFVPIVGWVLLAADLLNLLSLIGMLASPAYALACGMPGQALAAGLPAALFKRALKAETWTMHNLNPFSRAARGSRALRAAARLPTISNLLEVAQTTDQLFGVGLSLGGLVGMIQGAAFGAVSNLNGEPVTIQLPGGPPAPVEGARARFERLRPADKRVLLQAGEIALTGNAVWAVQDIFTEAEHLEVAVATSQAYALLYTFWHDLPYHDAVAELANRQLRAPLNPGPDTVAWAELDGIQLATRRRWWWPGTPEIATGRDYVAHTAAAIPQALRDFLTPRRNSAAGAFYGALVNQLTEDAFMLLEDDPDYLRWRFTDDAYLIQHLAESGLVLAPGASEGPLWALWQEARHLLTTKGRRALDPTWWTAAASRHQVPLLKLLPPETPVPSVWEDSIIRLGGYPGHGNLTGL